MGSKRHLVNGCCTQILPDDGILDNVRIERAIQGQRTALTRRERSLTVWRLANRNQWGLDRISAHLGYSRSQVAELLASARSKP